MEEVFLPCLFDLVDYSEAPKFVPANLKYFGILLESYFTISHIAHRVYLNYTLINLYPLYFAVNGGHFTDIIIVRQIFLVLARLLSCYITYHSIHLVLSISLILLNIGP